MSKIINDFKKTGFYKLFKTAKFAIILGLIAFFRIIGDISTKAAIIIAIVWVISELLEFFDLPLYKWRDNVKDKF